MHIKAGCKQFFEKRDVVNIAILLTTALAIGIYLVTTAVLISKDGIRYIDQAQRFSTDLNNVIKCPSFGYPFLIFMCHKLVALFDKSSSVYSWIYTAQGVALSCRLLAIMALYFIGKLFVGTRRSFWAIFILVTLPYAAQFGSDVLREWPHLLFLATGFLFLLLAAKDGKLWMFGAAGLLAGLGHIIRPECAQLVVYGVLWLLTRLFLTKRNISGARLIYALLVILIAFAIPAAPYMLMRGRVVPEQLGNLISASNQVQSEVPEERRVDDSNDESIDSIAPHHSVVKAAGTLVQKICEHLVYLYALALLVGVCFRFRKKTETTDIEKFFMPAFIIFNVTIMMLLHYHYGYLGKRHCLPLVVFSIFYIPAGLEIVGKWIACVFSKDHPKISQNLQLWFLFLVVAGTTICIFKQVPPMRSERGHYRKAARWLKKNTEQDDIIAVPDPRISFYAGRRGISYYGQKMHGKADYIVKVIKKNKKGLSADSKTLRLEELFSIENNEKNSKVVIYRNTN